MSPSNHSMRRRYQAVLLFLTCYVAAHFILSRISLALVQRDWGITGAFIYLPVKPDFIAAHERPLLYVHNTLRWFFFPICQLDQLAFGGPQPITSTPLRRISP